MPKRDETRSALPNIEENSQAINFEEKFRKIGFAFLLIIILCALSGLFSSGYFSSTSQVNDNKSLTVTYERFARLMKEVDLKITTAADTSQPVTVRLAADLPQDYQLEYIRPEPDKMYSDNHALYLVYEKKRLQKNLTLWLTVTPGHPGRLFTTVAVNDESPVSFTQFVYP
ncbi:TPA: hypothetical protein ACIPUI_000586 [Citrobacter freundii]